MSEQGWVGAESVAPINGTLFNTFTTAQSITPAGWAYPINPGFWRVGKAIRITLLGGISTVVTTPGTITWSLQIGGVAALSSGAFNTTITSNVLVPFRTICEATCISVGASTSCTLWGNWTMESLAINIAASAANAGINTLLGPNPPAVGTGFASTASTTIDVFLAQSISGATTGIQVRQAFLEVLN